MSVANPGRSISPSVDVPPGDGMVLPADYQALRQVAEWASGLRNESVEFSVAGDTVHLGQRSRGDVSIPTWTSGKTPRLQHLDIQVEEANAVDVAHGFDALFWSEAAVEKFLVPYFASCAGGRAVDALAGLLGAWNKPSEAVQPFALAHRTAGEPGEVLTLEGSVWVAFVDFVQLRPETSRLLGLPQFLEEFGEKTVKTTRSSLCQFRPGTISSHRPILPAAVDLRRIAETASSLRSVSMYVLWNICNGGWEVKREEPQSLVDRIAIPAHTPPMLPGRIPPSSVEIRPEGCAGPVQLAELADAVFWSTGAVEQFLFPYYASVEGAYALPSLQALHDVWWDAVAPSSRGVSVYAIVHLPKSDWEALPPSGSMVETSLGVVHVDPAESERTRILTLREFLEKYPARG